LQAILEFAKEEYGIPKSEWQDLYGKAV